MAIFGIAWIVFAIALALHVADEAAHDFLSVYNPAVRAVRMRVPFLPIPTFTFSRWMGGLLAGIALLLATLPLAFADNRLLLAIAWPLAIVIGIGNGLAHLLSSAIFHRRLPGLYTAPLMIASGFFLLFAVTR